jgi:hypothetical protein
MFGAGMPLSPLEKLVLGCVREHLSGAMAIVWDKQIEAINKVQRLPEGAEVDFYRMRNGRPTFDEELSFPNRTAELHVSEVKLEISDLAELTADIWCVNGFLFSIEYEGGVQYFDEAIGMDPEPPIKLRCALIADLATNVVREN